VWLKANRLSALPSLAKRINKNYSESLNAPKIRTTPVNNAIPIRANVAKSIVITP